MTKRPEDLFAPQHLPRRDECGQLVHPDMKPYPEQLDWGAVLKELGFEQRTVWMDDACKKRFLREKNGDCSWWLPVPPEGSNWRLVSIYFLDVFDLRIPAALYVRHRKFSARGSVTGQRGDGGMGTGARFIVRLPPGIVAELAYLIWLCHEDPGCQDATIMNGETR